jgi:IclR family KDG regulon transcriptional repressor
MSAESDIRNKAAAVAPGAGISQKTSSGTGGKFRVIERAIDVLKCMSLHPQGLTLTELSQKVDLNMATVLRFLKAFQNGGVVAQRRTGKAWILGPALYEMAKNAIGHDDIRDMAHQVMEELMHEVNETVQLAILADGDIIYIEKAEPKDLPLRINTQVGTRRPLHCTALGKIIAADLDWGEVKNMLEEHGMHPKTDQTITTLTKFRSELGKIRANGFAIDDREFNQLVVCAAAPIRNATGRVVAGISVSTFGISVKTKRFRQLISAVRSAAELISQNLGFNAQLDK